MRLRRFPLKLAGFVEQRPVLVIILAILITVALAPGTRYLKTETGFDTIVSPDSKVSKDSDIYQDYFGSGAIAILLSGNMDTIFSPDNLATLEQFESTFSPQNDQRVLSVLSPVTVLKMEAEAQGNSVKWNDQELVQNVLDNSGVIMGQTMEHLIADDQHVLVTVTPRGDLEYADSLGLVEKVEDFFKSDNSSLSGVEATVVSDTKLIQTIADGIGSNMKMLLVLSVGVMALILMLAFRVRWNLLSLLMVGVGALWTFGLMGYLGVPLSMATLAVLPILLGLGIDYSIQFHNRYQEEVSRAHSVARAIVVAMARMFPAVGIALIATVIGFITLYISEVPSVRDFGLMLALGVVLAYIVALFLLHSVLYIDERRIPVAQLGKVAKARTRHFEQALSWMAKGSLKYPAVILLIACSAGIGGATVDRWLETNTDFEGMMSQTSDVLQDVRELRDIRGYEGELNYLIVADDVTSPKVLEWMHEYQAQEVARYPELLYANSPATVVTKATGGTIPKADGIEQIFDNTPTVFARQVKSDDNRIASLSFGTNCGSMDDVQDLIDAMMQDADQADPPEGMTIDPAGSMALAAATVEASMGNRSLMNGLCLGAIFAVLLMVYRSLTRTVFTLIPVALVIGWSSLALYLAGIPLNPMTAILGVLVIGIGTEFMVLLIGRYEEEKKHEGKPPRDAMVIAVAKTGRAIVTTALTTLGGFGVLISSNFVLIRDFGIATTLSVFLCLIAAMVTMPPLVVWWDEHLGKKLPVKL